ncbi:protein yellow-like [Schistocerca cancellata]|uniref:protein yellow-like n=1 Tax=Schistocerca cancellata TaxID=274614 RepID=UPI002118AEE5|nr:protein yellow-like [Schistocerca cancellata]
MTRRLLLAGLLLVLLAASGGHRSRSKAASRGHHYKPALKTKPGGLQTPKLVNSRVAKQARLSDRELVTVKSTNEVTFDFDDDELEQQLLDNGGYIPKSAEPFQVIEDVSSRNRLFVTTPMLRSGIPASLSTIQYDGPSGLSLKPYPSLDRHRTTEDTITDCMEQLVSIAPITKSWTDDDTLYALDTGVVDITSSPKQVCPPKIITFDLRTDEIANITVIDTTACISLYVTLWVDPCPTGGAVAYSTDSFNFRLTVTDLTSGASKHLQSEHYSTRRRSLTRAGGSCAYPPFGLAGIAADNSCDGKMYMQSFASNIQDVLDKKAIRDAKDGQVMDENIQMALPGELSGMSGPLVVDPKGELLFFPIQDDYAIYCWNTSKPHDPQNFRLLIKDKRRMKYVSNMQIDPTSGRLWMLTNRFPSFATNTVDYSDVIYYIMYISIKGIGREHSSAAHNDSAHLYRGARVGGVAGVGLRHSSVSTTWSEKGHLA